MITEKEANNLMKGCSGDIKRFMSAIDGLKEDYSQFEWYLKDNTDESQTDVLVNELVAEKWLSYVKNCNQIKPWVEDCLPIAKGIVSAMS
jgi:hypothetical protein